MGLLSSAWNFKSSVEVLPCEGLEKNQQQYAYLLKRKFHSLKDHNDSKIAYCEFSGRRLC